MSTEAIPTPHPQVFVRNAIAKEQWVVLAHKMGEFRQLTKYFRVYGSALEADDAIRQRLATDPALRARYDGWTFYQLRIDSGVQNGLPNLLRPT
jgi:hypothetical protein